MAAFRLWDEHPPVPLETEDHHVAIVGRESVSVNRSRLLEPPEQGSLSAGFVVSWTRCTQNVRYDKTFSLLAIGPLGAPGRGSGGSRQGCWVAAQAWLRFAERLDELAAFAAGRHPPARTGRVPALLGGVRPDGLGTVWATSRRSRCVGLLQPCRQHRLGGGGGGGGGGGMAMLVSGAFAWLGRRWLRSPPGRWSRVRGGRAPSGPRRWPRRA